MKTRYCFGALAAVGVVSVAISLLTEHFLGWRPCYLCITQRSLFALMALVGFAGLVWPTRGALAAGLLICVSGLATAGHQVSLQLQPATATCGGGNPTLLENTIEWLTEHAGRFFEVTGFCTDPYPVLGVPMAGWAVLLFLTFSIATATLLVEHSKGADA